MATTNIGTSPVIAAEPETEVRVGTTLVKAIPEKIIMPQRFSHSEKGQPSQPAMLAEITPQMANLKYPVASQTDLMSRFGTEGNLSLGGKMIDLKTATARIPASFFSDKISGRFRSKIYSVSSATAGY